MGKRVNATLAGRVYWESFIKGDTKSIGWSQNFTLDSVLTTICGWKAKGKLIGDNSTKKLCHGYTATVSMVAPIPLSVIASHRGLSSS